MLYSYHVSRFKVLFTCKWYKLQNMQNCKSLENFLKRKFNSARSISIAVHDSDLQAWALAKASELKLPFSQFCALPSFIYYFKRRHRIVSRKITKKVARNKLDDLSGGSSTFSCSRSIAS